MSNSYPWPSSAVLLSGQHDTAIVRYFLERLEDQEAGLIDRLSRDAELEVARWPGLALRLVPDSSPQVLNTRCSTAGLYKAKPPTIIVAESTSRGRNSFTILHELAHHLQRNDPEWLANALSLLPPTQAEIIEHRICDEFAAEILLPYASLTQEISGEAVSASSFAEVFRLHIASRAAVAMRLYRLMPTDSVVMVCTERGEVVFSCANGDLAPIARGAAVDQGIIDRALAAWGDEVFSTLSFTYRTGTRRDGLRASACADHLNSYVFVVARDDDRYGRTPDWVPASKLCPCGDEYRPADASGSCSYCNSRLCPACGRCYCRDDGHKLCDKCYISLSERERRAGLTRHEECP